MKLTPTRWCTHSMSDNGTCSEITISIDDMMTGAWNASRAGVHQQEREAPFGWSWWKGLTQRMNIWRSWVVTWETHLPTAFLLVYWWRDDTEELGLTLYKASLSAASHSFKDHCCWNFSFRDSRTGSSRETSTLPSIMSEVGLFYVLKQRHVGINPITHDPRASVRREKWEI